MRIFYVLQNVQNFQGQWLNIEKFKKDRHLRDTANFLPHIVKNAKSQSTNKKYNTYFSKFRNWCLKHSIVHLPASVFTVALFMGGLVQQRVSTSVFEAYFYSINWTHEFSSSSNPCEDKFLKLVLEGGKRMLSKPINKKEPINTDILRKLMDFYSKDPSNVLQLRTFVMCLLGFSGFFRFSELSNIRMCDIKWENAHIEINIPKSKTDIYRRGNSVIIAKTGNDLCPVFWLNKYIDLLGLEKIFEDYLFTAVNYLKSQNVYKASNKSKPLSYTRAREILSSLKEIGLDSSKFALHSLRSGGVTAAANKNVSDRLLKIHGRWVTDKAKDGYIKDSIEQKLLVSMNLGL